MNEIINKSFIVNIILYIYKLELYIYIFHIYIYVYFFNYDPLYEMLLSFSKSRGRIIVYFLLILFHAFHPSNTFV